MKFDEMTFFYAALACNMFLAVYLATRSPRG